MSTTVDVASRAATALRRVHESLAAATLCPADGPPSPAALARCSGAYLPFERTGGQWVLAVIYDQAASSSVTRAMLAMEDDEQPTEDDHADALGEVANMAAGLLKGGLVADLADQITLGLPKFLSGTACVELLWTCEELATWRLRQEERPEADPETGDVLVCVGRLPKSKANEAPAA